MTDRVFAPHTLVRSTGRRTIVQAAHGVSGELIAAAESLLDDNAEHVACCRTI
jgi:hypothetical protein